MEWRLIQNGPGDGAWNMALDEAIVGAVGQGRVPPTLRFYTWSRPTLSLGFLQRTPGGVDLAECDRRDIPVVRRVTGGRAVLHAEELTYSVALPLQGPWRRLSVSETFALVGRGLIAGLRRLGVAAAVAEAGIQSGNDRKTGACFLLRRMPAVLVGGRKLIGSAQRRWERGVLQHGSLLLGFDPGLHHLVFPAWPRTEAEAGVTCLRALLGDLPPLAELMAALAGGWAETLDASWVVQNLTPTEGSQASDLVRLRYASPAWTFQR